MRVGVTARGEDGDNDERGGEVEGAGEGERKVRMRGKGERGKEGDVARYASVSSLWQSPDNPHANPNPNPNPKPNRSSNPSANPNPNPSANPNLARYAFASSRVISVAPANFF